jgi:PPP family 3-phenylpropionic acid transporter
VPVWRVAILQFMTFAARSLIIPFANLYLVSVGFSGTQIGLLISVSALVQLLLTPTLNMLADRAGQHRRLYYGLLTTNALATAGLVLSAHPLWLSGMIVARDSSDPPGAALLSQLTLTWLDQHGRSTYGRLRAFGSLGWGMVAIFSGRLIALGSYGLLFVLAGLINLAIIPLANVLPARTTIKLEQKRAPRQAGFYVLIASLFIYYIGMVALNTFSFVYFRTVLGASNEMLGVIASLAALAEVPAMFYVDRLLRRTTTFAAMIAGFLGFSILWLALASLTDNTWLIPLIMIRGIFFTLQNISMTLLVAHNSHPSNVATNQAIAQVTMVGLTVLLTGPISGWIFDHAGGRILFQMAALMPLLASIVLLAGRRYLAISQRPPSDRE